MSQNNLPWIHSNDFKKLQCPLSHIIKKGIVYQTHSATLIEFAACEPGSSSRLPRAKRVSPDDNPAASAVLFSPVVQPEGVCGQAFLCRRSGWVTIPWQNISTTCFNQIRDILFQQYYKRGSYCHFSDLHCLSVIACIRFKTLVLAYKAVSGTAPTYLPPNISQTPLPSSCAPINNFSWTTGNTFTKNRQTLLCQFATILCSDMVEWAPGWRQSRSSASTRPTCSVHRWVTPPPSLS